MAKLAYKQKGLTEWDRRRYKRFYHDGPDIVEGVSSEFREHFAKAVAERILKDWDKFVVSGEDGDEMWAYINIQEIKKDESKN